MSAAARGAALLAAAACAVALAVPSPARAVSYCGGTSDTCACGGNNPYPCCDNGGNCTWWAWHSACCGWGVALPGWGNANQWAGNARANPNYDVLPYPVIGAVACKESGTYGHVAWVVDHGGGQVTVTEQGCWSGYGDWVGTHSAGYFDGGYIVRRGQVECRPGETRVVACGSCGSEAQTCNKHGRWAGGTCVPAQPGPCDTGQPGVCGPGFTECLDGAMRCVPDEEPGDETCDGRDNDCDGASDEERVCEIEDATVQVGLWTGTSDLDGDGRADACGRAPDGLRCFLSSGHGFEQALPLVRLPGREGGDPGLDHPVLGDLDGDGRADVCALAAGGIVCWRSTGHGFAPPFDGPRLTDAERADPSVYTTLRLVDLDADGRADLCLRTSAGLACHPSTGAGFAAPLVVPELGDAGGWNQVQHYGTLRAGDVDGDGRADLCARGAAGVRCWLARPGGFEAIDGPGWGDAEGWDADGRYGTIRLADVSGDGRADLCGRSDADYRCHLSTGTGFGEAAIGPAMTDAEGWGERAHHATIRLGDVDGDGRADLCARSAAGVTCWLASARGAFDRLVPGPALADAGGWDAPSWYRTLRLADVDGDGRADLSARDADGLWAWPSTGVGFPTRLVGPRWSDADGWDQVAGYASIRVAGVGRRPGPGASSSEPAGEQAAWAPGGCAAARPGDGAGRAGGAATGAPAWLLLAALAAAAGRRGRAANLAARGRPPA